MDHLDLVMIASNVAIKNTIQHLSHSDGKQNMLLQNKVNMKMKKSVEIHSPREEPEKNYQQYEYADVFRMKAAVRNLMRTANNKLNHLINGKQIKKDHITVVRVYAIFRKIFKFVFF